MGRVWAALLGALVLAWSPARAQGWSETVQVDAAPSRRAARVGYQRDRLAVRDSGPGWYVVVDGYGRVLSAQQLARALGDARTYDLTVRAGRRQSTVGAVVTAAGPIAMLVGIGRITEGQWRDVPLMEASGFATLVVGMAGTAGGIGLLADRRPRRPPTYYESDQARRLVEAYNQRLAEAYGLRPEEASWTPPEPHRLDVQVVVGPTSLGVVGTF